MEAKRWTLGLVLAAAVSLWGLVEADASPFSSYVLSDDLGNMVNGTAAEASDWEDASGSTSGTDDSVDSGGADSGGDSSGGADDGSGSTDDGSGSGKDNNGHGNNTDGVDSSNKGQGNGGPNGGVDESCPAGGECLDDESKGGDTVTKTNNGKNK
jgi:hypothetical protein